jgi:hypothetical protein
MTQRWYLVKVGHSDGSIVCWTNGISGSPLDVGGKIYIVVDFARTLDKLDLYD